MDNNRGMNEQVISRDGAPWFGHTERLFRPERIALLSFVGALGAFDAISILSPPVGLTPYTTISVSITACLLFFLWSPIAAAIAIGAVVVLALFVGAAGGALIGAAFATLLVARLGSKPLLFTYIGGLVLAAILLLTRSEVPRASLAIFLGVAAACCAIGTGLRYLATRGDRLERKLQEQAQQQREERAAERRWFASELHDSIAHHLTIVSLHSQMLDDERVRESSKDAIQEAASQALTDLRFIINYSESSTDGALEVGDLSEVISSGVKQISAAGHSTVVVGDPESEAIPRGAEIVLARMVREASTNIVKYSGAGPVRFTLDVQPTCVTLEIRNPLSKGAPRVESSSGTGVSRMSDRALSLGGEFEAGPVGSEWVVYTKLPIVPTEAVGKEGATKHHRW